MASLASQAVSRSLASEAHRLVLVSRSSSRLKLRASQLLKALSLLHQGKLVFDRNSLRQAREAVLVDLGELGVALLGLELLPVSRLVVVDLVLRDDVSLRWPRHLPLLLIFEFHDCSLLKLSGHLRLTPLGEC